MRNLSRGIFYDEPPEEWEDFGIPPLIGMRIATKRRNNERAGTKAWEYYFYDENGNINIIQNASILEKAWAKFKYAGKFALNRFKHEHLYRSDALLCEKNPVENTKANQNPKQEFNKSMIVEKKEKNNICDFHIHPYDKLTNPKGIPVRDILKSAKENGVNTISLTSHNTLENYNELYECIKDTSEFDDMNIVVGFEVNSLFPNGNLRDVLVYLPPEKIGEVNNWLKSKAQRDTSIECQQKQLQHFKKVGKEYGLIFDEDLDVKQGQYAGAVFAENLKTYQANYNYDNMLNKKTIDPKFDIIKKMLEKSEISFRDILTKNPNWFFSELVRPTDSPFNVKGVISQLRPKIEDIIKIAHENGGKAIIAHPYHMDRNNIKEYLQLCKECGADGVESFYLTAKDSFEEDIKGVEEFCKDNNLLYGSGGTDFHTPNGSDYLGIGILGDENKNYKLEEEPNWMLPFTHTMKDFRDIMESQQEPGEGELTK